ncbi:hypothetical protein ABH15_01875 [Methanoculleus taiwanensis]|uniref:Adhesin domain-containing protein n=2 Tax=Methanoculleus taiwanensis TaxID=1550565 RepID=A0A498H4M2_9EURY|nr:hypothetical protein ABH15_01875 [Methanoculleus taiwanensis]
MREVMLLMLLVALTSAGTANGDLVASGVNLTAVRASNGRIEVPDTTGDLTAVTTNGRLDAQNISGYVTLARATERSLSRVCSAAAAPRSPSSPRTRTFSSRFSADREPSPIFSYLYRALCTQ